MLTFPVLTTMSRDTNRSPPMSCDTLVALPPATNGCIIFGKNSDCPGEEVHEVVYQSAKNYSPGDKLQCTYIEIEQAPNTLAVIMTKAAWTWGAEMGANDQGVCIGNEALWTKIDCEDDLTERLLGMDLVRLGLERGRSARESLDIMTSLLQTYGQGGTCREGGAEAHHNSFVIADTKEAWILETAGPYWAAEKITEGLKNISNRLTIQTDFDLSSPNLVQEATSIGLYDPEEGCFNFAKTFSKYDEDEDVWFSKKRLREGRQLMEDLSKNGDFNIQDMMTILRDENSGINMRCNTKSSQVSYLPVGTNTAPCCHWLTATTDPTCSLFKPFVFTPNVSIGDLTVSPDYGSEDPRIVIPRFQRNVDRKHTLYKGQKKLRELLEIDQVKGTVILQTMKEIEDRCISDLEETLKHWNQSKFNKVSNLFKQMCETETNIYK